MTLISRSVVDANGLHTSDDKITAFKHLLRSTSVTQLKSFLSLSGYYRPFVPHYARLSAPLLRLLKKDVPFAWGDAQENAFHALKTALTTAPVLAFPDFNKLFVIATDVSRNGLGAALTQTDDRGKNRPIAYASRILSSAESCYSVTDLETLAIVWALRHFRDLIYGYPITVYTDHKAATDLFKGRNLTGHLARWMFILEDYKPDIQYVPGKANVGADMHSRNVAAPLFTSASPPQSNMTEDVLMNAQRSDPFWSQVIKPFDSSNSSLPLPAEQLQIFDGFLIRYVPDSDSTRSDATQVIIPNSLVPQVLFLNNLFSPSSLSWRGSYNSSCLVTLLVANVAP